MRSLLVLIILLFVMILSRYAVTFLNPTQQQQMPEATFAMDYVGRDWANGVMIPMFDMFAHRSFNREVGYGRTIPAALGLIILPLQSKGVCTDSQILNCSNAIYRGLVLIVLFGFMAGILFLPFGQNRTPAALVFLTFLLGFPGALGLDRGNLDILFAVLLFLGAAARLRMLRQLVWLTVIEAVLLALTSGTKVTMLPFAAAFLLTSSHPIIFFVAFILSFAGFSYLPVVFLSSASILDAFTAASAVRLMFPDLLWTWCASWNHSVFALATVAITCTQAAIAKSRQLYTGIVQVIGWLLFILAISPIRKLYLWQMSQRKVFLVLLCLAAVAVNLLPYYAYAFRLYLSLPGILGVWLVAKDEGTKKSVMLSSAFLLLASLWIPQGLLVNAFILIHFYFLVRAASATISP